MSVFAKNIFAQTNVYHPFPVDSALWSIDVGSSWGGHDYFHIILKDDSMLLGKKYSKIYISGDAYYDSNDSFSCLIREDTNKMVFIKYPYSKYKDSSEFVLYDFNLKVNDTIKIKHEDAMNLNDSLIVDTLRVDWVDSLLTNVGYRKKLFLTKISSNNIAFTPEVEWVEGIGCIQNPLYVQYYGYFEFGYSVACFKNKNIPIIGSADCSATLNNYELNPNQLLDLIMYPNPVCEELHFTLFPNNTLFHKVEIYSSTGTLLSAYIPTQNSNETSISVNHYIEGIYFCKVSTNDNYFTKIFIVSKD